MDSSLPAHSLQLVFRSPAGNIQYYETTFHRLVKEIEAMRNTWQDDLSLFTPDRRVHLDLWFAYANTIIRLSILRHQNVQSLPEAASDLLTRLSRECQRSELGWNRIQYTYYFCLAIWPFWPFLNSSKKPENFDSDRRNIQSWLGLVNVLEENEDKV
jgi:hypothetical protein